MATAGREGARTIARVERFPPTSVGPRENRRAVAFRRDRPDASGQSGNVLPAPGACRRPPGNRGHQGEKGPHTRTPTAVCTAIGASSWSPSGFQRINPPDPGDRITAPIARSLPDRGLTTSGVRAGVDGPKVTCHCCHGPGHIPKQVSPPPGMDHGSRRSAIAGKSDFCLSFGISPAAVPLSRPPVLQYVHSIRLCQLVKGVFATILENREIRAGQGRNGPAGLER